MVRIDTSQDDANALLSKLSENRRQNVDICRGKQPLICIVYSKMVDIWEIPYIYYIFIYIYILYI